MAASGAVVVVAVPRAVLGPLAFLARPRPRPCPRLRPRLEWEEDGELDDASDASV